jgi:hypothetical protein
MAELGELDDIVRRTLTAFADGVSLDGWSGRREREAVSLYALSYLASAVRAGSILSDVSQIGVEIPVPQLPIDSPVHGGTKRPKAQVCKDIVVWPRPRMTCWDEYGRPTIFPIAIILWKSANHPDSRDIQWLQQYSRARANFVGYGSPRQGTAAGSGSGVRGLPRAA